MKQTLYYKTNNYYLKQMFKNASIYRNNFISTKLLFEMFYLISNGHIRALIYIVFIKDFPIIEPNYWFISY